MKMDTSYIFLLTLFISCISITTADQQYVYTIQYLRSFNRDKMAANLGCNHTSITYATYTYPNGVKDALFVHMNQGTYQSYNNCPFKHVYAKIFGTSQNYDELLKNDAASIAQKVKQMISRINPHYIVDWKCPLQKDSQKARKWLNTFVQKLSANTQVYVKAPASYFCYLVSGQRYLLDLGRVNNYIIEMYGEESGVYTSYEEMFEKEQVRTVENKDNYAQGCAKYPAYQNLVKNNPGKQFFIEKTLQKEETGFIGPKFAQYLEKAGKLYDKPAFLDSFPQQIIQL